MKTETPEDNMDKDKDDNLDPASEKDECDKSLSLPSLKQSSPSASGHLSSNSPTISTSSPAQSSARPSKTGDTAQGSQVRNFSHLQKTIDIIFLPLKLLKFSF